MSPQTVSSGTNYRPTQEQLARDELRRNYLRKNVYLPILVALVLVLALFGLLIYLAFGVNTPEAVSFIAGLSALTIILFSIPAIILMTILPIAWLALTLNRRQNRRNYPQTGPMAYRSRVQTVLWQLDGLLGGVRDSSVRLGERLTRPLIALHGRLAWWQVWLDRIRELLTRSS
ncbi:MAG TPA: hypothetical protein VF434_01610 [Promineifilum sp.]